MKKLNVLQVSRMYYPARGGIERVIQDISEGLRDFTDIEVLTCQVKGNEVKEIIHGVPVTRCASRGMLLSLPIAPSFFRNFKTMSKGKDIVHIHLPFPMADLAAVTSGYSGKLVIWWHSDVVRQKKLMLLYRPIMEKCLKRADAIVVASEGHIEGSSYLGPYKDKCHVIPFGVEKNMEKRADEYVKVKTVNSSIDIRFLFVGRLVYYKGCDVLIRAMSQVKYGHLDIVGEGPLKTELTELSEKLGLTDRVSFLGEVADSVLDECFRKCDVFVLPSVEKSEAFGIVQMEAMAYGKPVINTNLKSGVPYVSLHRVTGLTVEAKNSSDLADAMNWLAEHPEAREAYGAAACRRIKEHFSQSNMLKELRTLCEKLIGEEA